MAIGNVLASSSLQTIFDFGFAGLICAIVIALFVVFVLIAIWVYRDAESRGMNGALWLIVVILIGLVGLIIYLVVRSDHPVRPPGYYPPAPGYYPPPGYAPGYPPPGVPPTAPPAPAPPAAPPGGQTVVCRNCGTVSPFGAQFCRNCGATL